MDAPSISPYAGIPFEAVSEASMNMRIPGPLLAFAFATLLTATASAHGDAPIPDEVTERAIVFPDTAEYKTLVVDLHTHSVFSDGHVWPRIRVEEALRDGLDALAITEHLEYQPHRSDIPHPDRNRAYDHALASAQESELLVIRGSEITRDAPVGHLNAVFIEDANALLKVDASAAELEDPTDYWKEANTWSVQEAIDAANDQGAFVFWNHPGFATGASDGIPRTDAFHRRNAKAKKLHGIEVANGKWYWEDAFKIALKHDLVLIGVSDVHDLIDWDYTPHEGGHRPVTLVFAEERSVSGIRDALLAGRTVIWFQNLLIGRAEHLQPLIEASLSVSKVKYLDGGFFEDSEIAEVVLSNVSDVRYELRNRSSYTDLLSPDRVEVPPHSSVSLRLSTGKKLDELEFEVMNALVKPEKHPTIEWAVSPEE